ncbi:MAG: hypothetical protein R3C27_09810 [Hyphomonadaceae bacterium]
MPRRLIILVSIIATALALAWATFFFTKTGVLISSSDYMTSDLYDLELDPTATDEPVGKICNYASYNGAHALILLDHSQQASLEQARQTDQRSRLAHVELVNNWHDADCPVIRGLPN